MSIIQSIQDCHHQLKSVSKHINQVHYDEHQLLVIAHPLCQAAISLQGAHLLYWQPTNEDIPVVWLSEKALFKKGKAIRGGMPVCWPWFGNTLTPAHGFARTTDWHLKNVAETEEGVELVLSLRENDTTLQVWPHKFDLEMKFQLGKTCKAELMCRGDFSATSALHTYYGVSDINSIRVDGLGDNYVEKLSTVNLPKVTGEMTFNQEVDRIYTHPASVNHIIDGHRKIKINHFSHSDVVVWNPWADKSKAMNDLEDNSYQYFVCVETCRIHHPIMLTEQQFAHYGVEISIEK